MAPVLIDLTSSPEPEDSPGKVGRTALNGFQPRKQKSGYKDHIGAASRRDHLDGIGKDAARAFLERSPSKQRHPRVPRKASTSYIGKDVSLAALLAAEQAQHRPGSGGGGLHGDRRHAVKDTKTVETYSLHDTGLKHVDESRAIGTNAAAGVSTISTDTVVGKESKYETLESRLTAAASRPVLQGAGLLIIDDLSGTRENNGNIRSGPKPSNPVDDDSVELQPPSKRRRVDIIESKVNLERHGLVPENRQVLRETAHQDPSRSRGRAPPAEKTSVPHPPEQSARPQCNEDAVETVQRSFPPHVAPVPRRARFSVEENELLLKLKKVEQLAWKDIVRHFPGRSQGTLQTHFCNNLKNRSVLHVPEVDFPTERRIVQSGQVERSIHKPAPQVEPQDDDQCVPRRRKRRGAGPAAVNGFISWSEVNGVVLENPNPPEAAAQPPERKRHIDPSSCEDCIFPKRLSRILRHRELGTVSGRGVAAAIRGISEELKNHVFTDYRSQRHFTGTSGDVTCLAWASNGRHFAAGSIAISDDSSMQYNTNLNLSLGDNASGALQELPEHHIPRPLVASQSGNVNGLRAMRESQDHRLFMTVAAVGFSPDGKSLYTAGSDKKLRMYDVSHGVEKAECRYEIQHTASVDLLSTSGINDLVATGCRQSSNDSVQVFHCGSQSFEQRLSLSPSLADKVSALPLYPSALHFGIAPQHSHFLLAGFSSDSVDEDRDTAGETALWNVHTGQRLHLSTVTRNVFDVAWNPSPSVSSTAFGVASTPGTNKLGFGVRSIVQLYAPGQNGAREVLTWQCPAFDINDLIYCPHDERLIAAGATDGKVYVWDQRFADRNHKPLHILEHGESLNVLPHDRHAELADTGVRFLSWGATSSRLYSGSSDGVVKVWNPYRASESAHVRDAATFKTAIMSGAFSYDCRDLLIGEECGRFTHLSVGYANEIGDEHEHTARKFRLCKATVPPVLVVSGIAASHELIASGQIELRPMGDLPIRQAVQGPKYRGPYLKPSKADWKTAQEQYEEALDRQSGEHCESVMSSSQSSDFQSALKIADHAVQSAQYNIEQLQSRHDASIQLKPAAATTQRAFQQREISKTVLATDTGSQVEQCQLDCNHLPRNVDGENDVIDSHCSEQRIPAAFRALPHGALDMSELDCKQFYDLGLTAKCPLCSQTAPSPAMKVHLKKQCRQRCARLRTELQGQCKRCLAPTRSSGGETSGKLCRRCDFACFRCAGPLNYLYAPKLNADVYHCDVCLVAWEAGVLGYEVIVE